MRTVNEMRQARARQHTIAIRIFIFSFPRTLRKSFRNCFGYISICMINMYLCDFVRRHKGNVSRAFIESYDVIQCSVCGVSRPPSCFGGKPLNTSPVLLTSCFKYSRALNSLLILLRPRGRHESPIDSCHF